MQRFLIAFIHNQRGVAAIEFALMLPFLIMLSLGGFEVSRFLLIHQKADRIAYTVADVTTQSSSLTSSQIDLIYTASSAIMSPFNFTDSGTILLSSISKQPNDDPTIGWQYVGGGNLTRSSQVGGVSEDAALPTGFTLNDRDNIIISEVFYRYEPMFSLGLFDARDIYKSVIFKPRLGALTTPPS